MKKGVNGSCGYAKRGAMFGLDARIALAIFGALSVISGAALYSAIKAAKVETYRQFFLELEKASAAYYLDTGEQIALNSTDTAHLGYLSANSSNVAGWQGPYIENSISNTLSIKNDMTNRIDSGAYLSLNLQKSSTWTSSNTDSKTEDCSAGDTDCAEWFAVNITDGFGDMANLQQLFLDLDNAIDGSDGDRAGNVRYSYHADNVLFFKGRARKI